MSSIFGGSKQKSSASSSNKSYDFIKNTYSPLTSMAGTGANALQALLSGDTSGFESYKKATGFDAAAEAGSRGITGNAAASGLLRSGSTAKALQAFGNNMQNQYANNYMDRLLAQAGLGFQAGNLISGAGQTSTSTSSGKSKNGIGGFLGSLAGGIAASDRRLKINIFKVKTAKNGLNIYQYRYVDGSGPFIGVMADEVASIRPEALGPEINGFKTVNYDKLGDL